MPTRLNIYGQAISTTKKRPCIVATTANIVLSGASTPTSIDGVNIGVDDRILVWQQNSPQDNGIYRLETSQLLSRDYDFNINDDLYAGIEVLVLSGLTYSGKTFYLTTPGDLTIGSSSLTFDILAGQNGTSGTSGGTGSSGASGSSGTSGTEGTSGSSGSSGTSGTSGSSGSSGTSGTEGTSGSSGSSGTSGTEGTSGSSGTSGTEGTSGSSGTSGTEGTSGSSGSSGTSGTSGSSGSSGTSGTEGTSGSSGSSGTSGTEGTSGSSGTSGTEGTSGTSGLGSSGTSAFIVSSASTPSPINLDSSCYWYDTTNKIPMVSYYGIGVGSWSAGDALITARRELTGAGTQNEALAIGGKIPTGGFPSSLKVSCTEEYNGTSWSVGGVLSVARYKLAGAGTQNEGLAVGGSCGINLSCTEEYDGTSWSAGGALIIARSNLAGAGTQNAGLVAGGYVSGTVSCTEEYDGTSWSAGGALITGRENLAGAGTQNAGLAFGGNSGYNRSCTEEYNGTSWSAGGALIIARTLLAGAGTQNAGLAFGGYGGGTRSCTEEYNGTSWTAGGALITARYSLAGAGSQSAGLVAGGFSNANLSCTEEYSKIILVNSTGAGTSGTSGANGSSGSSGTSGGGSSGTSALITSSASTPSPINLDSSCYWYDTTNKLPMVSYYGFVNVLSWSVGGAMITGRASLAGAGTQNEALAIGGRTNTNICNLIEEYNGTSWSAGAALIIARNALAGAGTQNLGLAFGGSGGFSCTEEYNGTSWSVEGALITARRLLAGAGTQNEGLAFGGQYSAFLSCTEEYNGTSWSAGGALITARRTLAGAGTQNAGLAVGGSCGINLSCTEEYDGTSWSVGGALIIARYGLAGAGTQNAGLVAGGFTNANTSCTEEYNGTSWSAGGVLITAREGLAAAGSQSAGLAFGGYSGRVSCTEEYSYFGIVNSTGVGVSYGTINYLPKYTGTTAIGISQIFDNGTSVGIGTTSPSSILHIFSSTLSVNTRIESTTTSGESSITLLGKNSSGTVRSGAFKYDNADILRIGTASAIDFRFETSDIERMRITSAGNVGIGTSSPSYKLHVEGSGTANEVVGWFNNQGNFSTMVAVRNANRTAYLTNHATTGLSTPNYTEQLTGALSLGVGGGGTPIQFYNGSPASVKMTILDNGNVGIGTASPSTKLEVVGTITTTSLVETSSIKIKENVKTLDNPLDIIKKLRGVEYNRIGETYNEIGVIAEEVNDVLPQVVNKDEEGNPTSVSYGRLTALLIEVVKKQDEQIENLIKRIEQLEK